MRFLSALIVYFATGFGANAAISVDVVPASTPDIGNIVIPGNTVTRGRTQVRLKLSCFPTNLRGIANPLARESTVLAYLDFINAAGSMQTLIISFPALMAAAQAAVPYPVVNNSAAALPNIGLSGIGNTILIDFPYLKTTSIQADGSVDSTTQFGFSSLQSVRFDQVGAPGGAYVGTDGPLTASASWITSPDGKNLEISASFPGAAFVGIQARYLGETRTGFCGAWYSPLMMFFDEKRPAFNGKSRFKLQPSSGEIYWVEKGAPGYFLAIDRNNNGTIDSGEELFGDAAGTNGFDALAKEDTNGDGWIDKKDKFFGKLLLWNDNSGDGVSQPKELLKMQDKGVTRIRVTPENHASSFGSRAKYDRQSIFEFSDSSGATQRGTVLDIWFSAR